MSDLVVLKVLVSLLATMLAPAVIFLLLLFGGMSQGVARAFGWSGRRPFPWGEVTGVAWAVLLWLIWGVM